MEKVIDDLLEKVRLLNQNLKFDEVINLLDDKLLDEYNDSNLYIEKANALYKTKKFEEFEENVTKAFSLDPKNPKAINCFGIILGKKGDRKGSIENYLKAIKQILRWKTVILIKIKATEWINLL